MEMTKEQKEWFTAQPKDIQALFLEFPPHTKFKHEDKVFHLIGYTECDSLIVSEIDPCMNYGEAVSDSEQWFISAKDCRSSEERK